MLHKPAKKTTAVGENGVKPTDYQIRSGHFVVPREFYESHKDELDWKSGFSVIAFGKLVRDRKIDYDRRLNVRLRDDVEPGDTLALTIKDGELIINKM